MKIKTVISTIELMHQILRYFWNTIILVMFVMVAALVMIQFRDSPETMSKVAFSVKIISWVMISYIILDMFMPLFKWLDSSNKR
jgi:hypothetical protein